MLGLGTELAEREQQAGVREEIQIWLRVRWREKKPEAKEMRNEKRRIRIAYLFLAPAMFTSCPPSGYVFCFFTLRMWPSCK